MENDVEENPPTIEEVVAIRPGAAFINLEPPDFQLAVSVDAFEIEEIGDEDESVLVSASTDAGAARAYIYSTENSEKTIANVKKELYRFLKWCREVAGKPLAQLRVEDLNAYKAFLADPQPAAEWVSKRKHPRFLKLPGSGNQFVPNPEYRPFATQLTQASRRQAVLIVKAFLKWCRKAGYLRRDPGALVKNLKKIKKDGIERYLEIDVINLALQASDEMYAEESKELKRNVRDRFLTYAYFHTGARLNELVTATMGSIHQDEKGLWWLTVVGKGNKERHVPFPDEVWEVFRPYRLAFGLPPEIEYKEATPLLLSARRSEKTTIKGQAVESALKRIFVRAAETARSLGNAKAAKQLEDASTHWLRHSMLTYHANNGVPLKTLQLQAGHADINTTAGYLHKEKGERHAEIQASAKTARLRRTGA